jgi:hypothetical protein
MVQDSIPIYQGQLCCQNSIAYGGFYDISAATVTPIVKDRAQIEVGVQQITDAYLEDNMYKVWYRMKRSTYLMLAACSFRDL